MEFQQVSIAELQGIDGGSFGSFCAHVANAAYQAGSFGAAAGGALLGGEGAVAGAVVCATLGAVNDAFTALCNSNQRTGHMEGAILPPLVARVKGQRS